MNKDKDKTKDTKTLINNNFLIEFSKKDEIQQKFIVLVFNLLIKTINLDKKFDYNIFFSSDLNNKIIDFFQYNNNEKIKNLNFKNWNEYIYFYLNFCKNNNIIVNDFELKFDNFLTKKEIKYLSNKKIINGLKSTFFYYETIKKETKPLQIFKKIESYSVTEYSSNYITYKYFYFQFTEIFINKIKKDIFFKKIKFIDIFNLDTYFKIKKQKTSFRILYLKLLMLQFKKNGFSQRFKKDVTLKEFYEIFNIKRESYCYDSFSNFNRFFLKPIWNQIIKFKRFKNWKIKHKTNLNRKVIAIEFSFRY